MPRKPPTGAQAVLRAVALLKAFHVGRPERDVQELASEAGLSRSTAHRILGALESEGLVVRHPESGRYSLGPSIVALGARALRSMSLRATVHPELERLAIETGETATLEVLSFGKMLILDETLGAHLIGASPSLGTAWALHATSTGKAVLAELPPDRAPSLLPLPLERFTRQTITSVDELGDELSRVREVGFATVSEELEEGYAAVGAVIRIPMRDPYATLSVGGPSARLGPGRLQELGRLVKDRARAISKRLGFEATPVATPEDA
jgi:IclR family transcriptional regulator, acetate operon repressor